MTIGFTGSPLLRLDRERPDDAAFARHLADPQARLLRLDGLDPVLDDEAGALVWGTITDRDPDAELALLGLLDGRPAFVALTAATRGKPLYVLLGLLAQLPGPDAAIYGAARSLVHWHAGHRFCGRCGASTTVARAGWSRRCPQCAAEHFPRTDPVVIMLAEYDVSGHLDRVDRGRLEVEAVTEAHAGDVVELIDDRGHARGGRADAHDRALRRWIGGLRVEQSEAEGDGGERAAQVVAERGDEGLAEAQRLGQLAGDALEVRELQAKLALLVEELEEGADLAREDSRLDRLEQEIDGAGLVALKQAVRLVVIRGQEYDRDIARPRIAAHDLGELESVDLRHLHVDQRQRIFMGQQQLEGLACGARGVQLAAVLAQQGAQGDEVLLDVVDEEDRGHKGIRHHTCLQ